MGYFTYYELEVKANSHDAKDILKYLAENKMANYAFDFGHDEIPIRDNCFELECGDAVKWYDHDDDMCDFSREFPDADFYLHGDGEDKDDEWKTWYKGGKIAGCKAIERRWPEEWT